MISRPHAVFENQGLGFRQNEFCLTGRKPDELPVWISAAARESYGALSGGSLHLVLALQRESAADAVFRSPREHTVSDYSLFSSKVPADR